MTLPARKFNTARLAAGAVLGLVSVTTLTGCIGNDGGGGGGGDNGDCAPADEAMEGAKEKLDETSGVDILLSTNDSPSGIALIDADATVVRPESFEGTFTAQAFGQQAPGEAVGISEDFWVKVSPLYPDWTEVDQDEYPIPALATLLDPDKGVSNVLVNTDDLSDGEKQRDENDTSKTYCYYEGTVSGAKLKLIFPSAGDEDFSVEYAIDGEGALRKATATGDFYDDQEKVTYVLDIAEYDVERDIQPPK